MAENRFGIPGAPEKFIKRVIGEQNILERIAGVARTELLLIPDAISLHSPTIDEQVLAAALDIPEDQIPSVAARVQGRRITEQ